MSDIYTSDLPDMTFLNQTVSAPDTKTDTALPPPVTVSNDVKKSNEVKCTRMDRSLETSLYNRYFNATNSIFTGLTILVLALATVTNAVGMIELSDSQRSFAIFVFIFTLAMCIWWIYMLYHTYEHEHRFPIFASDYFRNDNDAFIQREITSSGADLL